MLLIAIALLQAAEPAQDAAVQPVSEPVPAAEASEDSPEMKMKKVCRKVVDPRVGTLAGRHTVCKYEQAEGPELARK